MMNSILLKKYINVFRSEPWRAFGVHIFTAIGVVFAMFALTAAGKQDQAHMFFWLGCAFVIDGVDGFFARKVKVTQVLPRFSGETLDLVIDYITYVFVPAYFIYVGGIVPDGLSLFSASLICFTSLYHFADANHKTKDHYFSGFPALWNIILFYILISSMSKITAFVIIIIFCFLTFIPIKFVHPVRVVKLRPITLLVTVIWLTLSAIAIYDSIETSPFDFFIVSHVKTVSKLQTSDTIIIGLYITIAYLFLIGVIRSIKGNDNSKK